MAKIMVDPAKLELVSGKIQQQASDYERIYNQLYSEVEGMAKAWQGVDNVAYTNQIAGFKDDLTLMKKLMDDYAEFLKISATTYRQTQEQITSQAKTLTS